MNERVKPSNELREGTHIAQEADYQALAAAVVKNITLRKKDTYLRFPYFATFDSSFPKGVLTKKEGLYNYYKAKTYKLADWLHARGYLPENAKGIMKAQRDWGYREKRLERMLLGEIPLDNNLKTCDNDVSDLKEEE